jgi:hypothetical protein
MTSRMRNFGASHDEWRPDVRFCGIEAVVEKRVGLRSGISADNTRPNNERITSTVDRCGGGTGTLSHAVGGQHPCEGLPREHLLQNYVDHTALM